LRPHPDFLNQPKRFWAHVRSISEQVGYTDRATKQIKVPSLAEICGALIDLGLSASHVMERGETATDFGASLCAYFKHRADALNDFVEPRLMDVGRARREYDKLRKALRPTCPLPMNKQKGRKKSPAYLTGIVNMLIEHHGAGRPCDYDPRKLTTVTADGIPLRTLARRIDGAFPSAVNPVAVWEIKEYYYTTSFGSRVADGVYETLLDGMELEELREHESIDVKHYLMLDAHYTWWVQGRSYLCRVVDMLHMGYIDEALFGYEVLEQLPTLVAEWLEALSVGTGRRPTL